MKIYRNLTVKITLKIFETTYMILGGIYVYL